MQIKAIEDEIDLGQIEEVIEMSKTELELIDFYYGKLYHPWNNRFVPKLREVNVQFFVENKGWELVAQAKLEADDLLDEMADSIYFTSPEARPTLKKMQEEGKK